LVYINFEHNPKYRLGFLVCVIHEEFSKNGLEFRCYSVSILTHQRILYRLRSCENKFADILQPKMDSLDIMSHVVLGLPGSIQDRLNPSDVSTVDDLVSVIIQFKKPFVRISNDLKSSSSSSNVQLSSATLNTFPSLL